MSIQLPKYISGPVSFSKCRIKGKDLYLFGDYHHETLNMCKSCRYLDRSTDIPIILGNSKDCYTLSAWIQSILEQLQGTKNMMDLYVEDPYSLIGIHENVKENPRYAPFVYDGRLVELMRVFRNHKIKNLRYHHIDIRKWKIQRNNLIYLTELHTAKLYNGILSQINQYPDLSEIVLTSEIEELCIIRENMIREYAFLCATSCHFPLDLKNWISKIVKTMKEYNIYYLQSVLLSMVQDLSNTESLTKEYQKMKLHPIGKQFRKLYVQEKRKGNIDITIKSMAGFIIDENEWPWFNDKNFSDLKTQIHKIKFDKKEYRPFHRFISPYFSVSFLLDIYSIPRILYDYPYNQIKIYSAGNQHIKIIQKFMLQFYQVNLQIFKEADDFEENRCISTQSSSLSTVQEDENLIFIRKYT